MQKAISLLLIGAVVMSVFLCSCESQSGNEESSTGDDEKIIAVIEKSIPITKGNLITKTKTDGKDIIVDYYDSFANLIEEFVWANGETQKQHTVYAYTQDNAIASVTELTPDGKHMLVTAYQYAGSDLYQKTISEYEDGRLNKTTTYNAQDEVTGYSLSHYGEEDRLEKIERFDSENKLEEYFLYEYDSAGRTSRYASYTADDQLKQYSTFTFNTDGKLTEEKYFNGNDELESYYKFSYYASGTMKDSVRYDANGNILSQDFFEDETTA